RTIYGNAAHPAGIRIGSIGALLENRWISGGVETQLVPTHTNGAICSDRVIDDERFVIAKVPVGEPEHHAIPQRIEHVAAGLRNARSSGIVTRERVGGRVDDDGAR